jgi:hypothetical protein
MLKKFYFLNLVIDYMHMVGLLKVVVSAYFATFIAPHKAVRILAPEGCQIFLCATYQDWEKYTKCP